MARPESGIVRIDEAYSKTMVLTKLGISQRFWDKLLDEGLPYTAVGHSRWVLGRHLIEHMEKHSTTKSRQA